MYLKLIRCKVIYQHIKITNNEPLNLKYMKKYIKYINSPNNPKLHWFFLFWAILLCVTKKYTLFISIAKKAIHSIFRYCRWLNNFLKALMYSFKNKQALKYVLYYVYDLFYKHKHKSFIRKEYELFIFQKCIKCKV